MVAEYKPQPALGVGVDDDEAVAATVRVSQDDQHILSLQEEGQDDRLADIEAANDVAEPSEKVE